MLVLGTTLDDAMAHLSLAIQPPAIERSITSFLDSDFREKTEAWIVLQERKVDLWAATLDKWRADIAEGWRDEDPHGMSEIVEYGIQAMDRAVLERDRETSRLLKIVDRLERGVRMNAPERLSLFLDQRDRWRSAFERVHSEGVDFACFLRAIRAQFDEEGRQVVASFSDARSWKGYTDRLLN